jgi:pimeloyl-ACP methyl ester carboxylesterase
MRKWSLALLLLTGCQTLENSLVFHPTPSHADATPLPYPLEDVTLQTADGVKLHARWCPHPETQGVLLYFHGNAGNLEHRGKLMHDFWRSLDRSVLIVDYPGFGRSEGSPTEAGCYASAEAAYEWLTRVKGIAPDRIVIAGESLGGGVAVDLASKRPHQALVLIRTFTSVPDVVKTNMGISSANALMVNRFESLKKIPSCKSPVFLAQADRDQSIPYEHAEQMRAACTGRVHFHRLRGLGHNDALPRDFFEELRAFLDSVR